MNLRFDAGMLDRILNYRHNGDSLRFLSGRIGTHHSDKYHKEYLIIAIPFNTDDNNYVKSLILDGLMSEGVIHE